MNLNESFQGGIRDEAQTEMPRRSSGVSNYGVSSTSWYLVGANYGWADDAAYMFTANGDGTYSINVATLSGEIKIKEAGTWSTSFGSNGSKLKENTTYYAGQDGPNIVVDGIITNATITIDINEYTVYVTGRATENTYTSVYLVGDFGDGWSEDIANGIELIKTGTNTYTADFTLTAELNYFRFKAGANTYGTGGGDIAVEMGESYTISQVGYAFVLGAGTYSITLNLANNASSGTFTVASTTSPTPDPTPEPITEGLYILPFAIASGETKTVEIMLDTPDYDVTAFQFYMALPAGLSIPMEDDEYIFDFADRCPNKSGHQIQSNYRNGKFLVLCYSSKSVNFTGRSGAVATFPVTAAADFNGGEIEISDIEAAENDGTKHRFTSLTVKVSIASDVSTEEYLVNSDMSTSFGEETGMYIFNNKLIMSWDKANGLNIPYFRGTNEVRFYAGNAINFSLADGVGGSFTKLIFQISSQGRNRPTPLIASSGNLTYDYENSIVTWEGDATSVDFVVENRATASATGGDKGAGQFCFTGFSVEYRFVEKFHVAEHLYNIAIPQDDICYDGEYHAASVTKIDEVGDAIIYYTRTDDNTTSKEAPKAPGSYDVYLEFAESALYYAMERTYVGSFTIYQFDDKEWAALVAMHAQMQESGWTAPWDLAAGITAVSRFDGLVVEQGHVTGIDLSNKDLTAAPAGIAAFTCLKSLDLSHNRLSGNAGLLVAPIPSLTSLNLSYNCFSDLYPMISPDVKSLDLSHQTIDRVVPLNMSALKAEDIAMTVPTILLYDHESQTYIPNVNLLCTTGKTSQPSGDDWGVQLSVNNGNISMPYVSPNKVYRGESGDVLDVYDMKSGSTFKISLIFEPGDVNFVGGTDATDLQATILYAFGGYRNYPFNFTAADTYRDDIINVQDVICTVNILLSQTGGNVGRMLKARESVTDDAEAYIYMRDGKVMLYTEKPVAAMCADASGDIKWCLDNYGMMQTLSHGSVVGYSLSGMVLPVGETVIGTYTGCAEITGVSLSDSDAQAVRVVLGENDTNGIESLTTGQGGDCQYFDITGRRVDRPAGGVYIKKNSGKTVKVISNHK